VQKEDNWKGRRIVYKDGWIYLRAYRWEIPKIIRARKEGPIVLHLKHVHYILT
jgi:hypothetical protein